MFVHYSVIEAEGFKTLKDGEEVLYEIQEGPKGLHAVKVQRKVTPESLEKASTDTAESSESSQDMSDSAQSSEQSNSTQSSAGKLAVTVVREENTSSDEETAPPELAAMQSERTELSN